ncbi:UNVERIFIED_CONTAM: Regulator of nonsense transcripts 1 [Sesamum radiatum]|uniref:Regulator of nonsense transcripts 1 n=1 Tax=Sesamum radiatum TaxID=300843 RepID=A0AAW2S6I6_SESRA
MEARMRRELDLCSGGEIPQSFESVDQYLGSYVFPLLEETRAELASALETVYKAPFAEVTSFNELKGDKLQYHVKVDHWRNRKSDGKEPYRTLPGDVVLLSDLKPETVCDLQRVDRTFTFASVTNTVDDETRESGDNCTPSNFKVKTEKHVEVGDGQSNSLYVLFLMNMTTNKRIWNALSMRRNLKIIKKVLCKNDSGEEYCDFCPLKCNSDIEVKFGLNLFSNLNDSQIEAISASLLKTECNHKSSVELIWGPPGTGKTTTLSILLYTLLKMNVRTLICAPTNVAIKELASRLIALVRNSVEAEYEKSFLPCPLGDMLIFGNKDRLKVGSDIEEISLDYRLERLSHCLVPQTGWRHCVATMLGFLEDCVSQYQIYMDNELIKAKESLQHEVQSNKSFLEFARDRFAHIATPLRRCMSTFLTHLPRSCILENNFQRIVQLMSLLDSMEIFLFEDSSMTSEELENSFLQQQMISSEFVDTSSLVYTRSQCLSILRSLQASLDKLSLPVVTNIASTTEFCFQKASLIFCTTSSSYKLHSFDVEPFKLLVIDEAAQVKECESIIALQIPDVRHAILVGDERQLPAMVNSKVIMKFANSLN